MIDGLSHVTQVKVVRQVVKLTQGNQTTIIERQGPPKLSVVKVGVQGPVGTVAEEVLNRAEAAEKAANEAKSLATENSDALSLMLDEMTEAFAFQTGIINGITQ